MGRARLFDPMSEFKWFLMEVVFVSCQSEGILGHGVIVVAKPDEESKNFICPDNDGTDLVLIEGEGSRASPVDIRRKASNGQD
jgi:hypothetical protein